LQKKLPALGRGGGVETSVPKDPPGRRQKRNPRLLKIWKDPLNGEPGKTSKVGVFLGPRKTEEDSWRKRDGKHRGPGQGLSKKVLGRRRTLEI